VDRNFLDLSTKYENAEEACDNNTEDINDLKLRLASQDSIIRSLDKRINIAVKMVGKLCGHLNIGEYNFEFHIMMSHIIDR